MDEQPAEIDGYGPIPADLGETNAANIVPACWGGVPQRETQVA
ncbi:MAG TPA: hypothetical protein VFT67_14020 [Jatrophihabitantaceae bacterium]|nr:hypothetical protein [Jatrophihabitantaceae bacterium]